MPVTKKIYVSFLFSSTLPLWHSIRPNLLFLSATSNANLKLCDLPKWKMQGFFSAQKSDDERQAYTSTSRHVSFVISKIRHKTCSSLSPKSDLKSIYSMVRSVADSSSSSYSSPNFTECSSPKKTAMVFANNPRVPKIPLSVLRSPALNFMRFCQHFILHCYRPRQSFLPHAKALPWLLHGSSPSRFNFQLFLGPPLTSFFPFLHLYLRLKPSSSLLSKPYDVTLLPLGTPARSPLLFLEKFFGSLFSLMLSFFNDTIITMKKKPLPSGHWPHHRLPFVFSYSFSYFRFVTNELLLFILFCHLISGNFVFQLRFPLQIG